MVTTFDPFGALMISHNNGIYLSSFCVVYLYITSTSTFRFIIIVYYWIIITGYCKHEFGTKNMLYSLKRLSYYTPTPPHPYPSPPLPLPTTVTFFSPQGFRSTVRVFLFLSLTFFVLLVSEQPALIVSQPVVAWRFVSTVLE